MLKNYFEPIRDRSLPAPGNFTRRQKTIYYDTDGIQERQLESVMICNDCAGMIRMESVSNRNPLSLGVEIPVGACSHCHDEGYRMFESGKKSKKYKVIQMIDRVGKKYFYA